MILILIKIPKARLHQLTEFERGQIIRLREARLSFRKIIYRTNRNSTTDMRCYQAWVDNAENQRRLSIARLRNTNEVQYRRLRLMAITDRFTTIRSLVYELLGGQGHNVTERTVNHRMNFL